jgi:hypothetical protein
MTQGPQQHPAPDAVVDRTVIRKTVGSYGYERSVYQVEQEFAQLNPATIGEACRAWKRAADELFALAEGLKAQAAVPLSAAWQSPASPGAQQQLQQAEATARALGNDCLQMAHATDYAAQYAQWYKDNRPTYVDAVATGVKGAVTGNGLTAGAEQSLTHLTNLLSRYNEVTQILPDAVQTQLVQPNVMKDETIVDPPGAHGPGGSVAAPSFGGGAGASGASGLSVPGVSTSVGGPGGGFGAGPSGLGPVGGPDPYAAGGSLAGAGLGGGLAGFDPNALGGTVGGTGGLGNGLGAGLGAAALGAAGLGAGGLVGGLGAGRPGSGFGSPAGAGSLAGPGAGGLVGGSGAGVVGEGVIGSVGAQRGVAGGPMAAPMHGASGRQEGVQERERSTWLVEDDDVWGGGRDVPPPVITS